MGGYMKMNIKRALSVLVTVLLFASFIVPRVNAEQIGVSAASAILIEAEGGRVLYEKNADVRRGMASTTKIMTALVALESGNVDRTVTVPADAVGVEGSSLYLVAGEKMTLRQLLYALMLRSANDVAAAIAIAVGGSVEGFAEMMNGRAEKMGLENTHFENPHGLDGDGHYTTARELAIITAEALKNEDFVRIVSTFSARLPLDGVPDRRVVVNHNRLLSDYEGCIGVKTGFTKKCGRCLVTAAERGGVRLIAVTLNAPDDWSDHKRMLDHGFGACKRVRLSLEASGRVSVVGGIGGSVGYLSDGEAAVTLPYGTDGLRMAVELQRFYYAPINEGEILGRIAYYDGDTLVAENPIVATESVKAKKVGLFRRLLIWLRGLLK
jgi:D-alanyl-D-alanine carboxypeptidase/D-alanyl-D-alanine carboxypeptidase (penicillin-binding protein 5/6)